MIEVLAKTSATPTWVQPAVIAAVIAALVSLLVHWSGALKAERSRRRELLAEAYEVCLAYKEFPYRIRRRRADIGEERARLVNDLNRVQERLAFFEAWTSLEGKRVREAYRSLVGELRSTAGREISQAWTIPGVETDEQISIQDIDLSSLEAAEKRFLLAVRGRVGTLRDRLAALGRNKTKP